MVVKKEVKPQYCMFFNQQDRKSSVGKFKYWYIFFNQCLICAILNVFWPTVLVKLNEE